MEDGAIIALFWNRSEEAITQTARKYGALCHSIARRIVFDEQDAEECVNDTYAAMWNTIPPAKPNPLSAYIARITRNLAMKKITYHNRCKRANFVTVSIHELEECIPANSTPENTVDERDLANAIGQFLAQEDYESRNMFLRRYWFHDSIDEIAKRFGVSQSKVKSQLMRVRNRLKNYLIKEEWIYEC